MKEYLTTAIATINPDAPLITDNNKFFYRNRIIDKATTLYLNANPKLVYEHVFEDVITDQYRADHYGVEIGTSLGLVGCRPKIDSYIVEANVKKQLKNLFTFDMIGE